jgi:hypothetical protein
MENALERPLKMLHLSALRLGLSSLDRYWHEIGLSRIELTTEEKKPPANCLNRNKNPIH